MDRARRRQATFKDWVSAPHPPKRQREMRRGHMPPRCLRFPVSKQKKAPGQVTAALDNARLAGKAYDKVRTRFDDARRLADDPGHKLNKTELIALEGLKAERDAAFEKSRQAGIKLTAAVSATINKSSCTIKGICTFSSARKAAADLDEAVRTDSGNLQITKDEARDRQIAVRTATNSVLSDLAYDSLNSLFDGRAKTKDSKERIKEVVSWVTTRENYPEVTTPFARLKTIVNLLKDKSPIDKKIQREVAALIDDLLRGYEDKGMSLTTQQKSEIGAP
jgi:hypothetical protein